MLRALVVVALLLATALGTGCDRDGEIATLRDGWRYDSAGKIERIDAIEFELRQSRGGTTNYDSITVRIEDDSPVTYPVVVENPPATCHATGCFHHEEVEYQGGTVVIERPTYRGLVVRYRLRCADKTFVGRRTFHAAGSVRQARWGYDNVPPQPTTLDRWTDTAELILDGLDL